MHTLNARPNLLKKANLSLVRRVIKSKGTATRAEIAEETRISSTTIRSILTEMMDKGEIESIGYDQSSGGRKAERYRLRSDKYYGAAFCIMEHQVHSLLVNVFGEIVEAVQLDCLDGDFKTAIIVRLDRLTGEKEIKSIGLGVPGAVEGEGFWKKGEPDGTLCKVTIGEMIAERYHIPVILENDLNATAIGFGRDYEKKFLYKEPDHMNFAYLYFEKDCISAGFIAENRVIRGCNNFAGELGFLPMDENKLLDECIVETMDDVQYMNLVVKIVGCICGILNPEYVVFAGAGIRKNCMEGIRERISMLLPKHMVIKILYSADVWKDFYTGMAYLTAEKMFDEIQFIKE